MLKNQYELNLEKLNFKKEIKVEDLVEKLNELSPKCSNLELSDDRKEVMYFDIDTESAEQFYNDIFQGLTFKEYIRLFDVISENFTDIAPLFDKINDNAKGYTIYVNEQLKEFKAIKKVM